LNVDRRWQPISWANGGQARVDAVDAGYGLLTIALAAPGDTFARLVLNIEQGFANQSGRCVSESVD
jgi:hypothetical protein